MRIIKTRLGEMLPDISVFLDVDALGCTQFKDFEHVDLANTMLVFLTAGFLKSGPCAREVRGRTRKYEPRPLERRMLM